MEPAIHPAATVALLRKNESSHSAMEVLLLQRNSTLVFGPDHWVFPGGRIDDDDFIQGSDEEKAAKVAATRETFEEAGLTVHHDSLVTLSHWTTPSYSPRRFATWFFVACYEGSEQVKVDGGEIVAHQWLSPENALQLFSEKEMKMMPPTEHTLREMSRFDSPADYLAMCDKRPLSKVVG